MLNLIGEYLGRLKVNIINLFPIHNGEVIIASPKKLRKKSDTSKLTQYQYDFIMQAHSAFKLHNQDKENKNNKKTVKDLTIVINEVMGTDKSTTTLGNVWRGNINRDSLAVGKAYFRYEDDI